MAIQTVILIDQEETATDMARVLLAPEINRGSAALKLKDYMKALTSGMRRGQVVIGVDAVKASATLTLTSVIATDAIAVNGLTFTAVASGATAVQFNVGADDAATAVNLAAAINAHTDLVGLVTATALLTVVTVTAARPGLLGNAITLTSADATIVASAGRLAGGTNGAEIRTHYYGSETQS